MPDRFIDHPKPSNDPISNPSLQPPKKLTMSIVPCCHPRNPSIDRRLEDRLQTQPMGYNMTLHDRGSGRHYVICNDTRCRINPLRSTPEMSPSEIDDMFSIDEEAATQDD